MSKRAHEDGDTGQRQNDETNDENKEDKLGNESGSGVTGEQMAEMIRMEGARLLAAVRARKADEVASLLAESTLGLFYHSIELVAPEPSFGMTALMIAAFHGDIELVDSLLENGAQWNALDDAQKTAGDHARSAGHSELYEKLVDHGCRVELVMGAINMHGEKEEGKETMNSDYLKQKLVYEDGLLLDEDRQPVMMGWEKPLMDKHAAIICQSKGDVMNVGYGLGLIDDAIEKCGVNSHTIIEPHPDVIQEIKRRGVDKLKGVTIVPSTWQDAVNEGALGTFDGIFYDTWGEFYEDLRAFHEELPALLNPGGIYSFFNGLGGHNQYFHDVYCRVAELELSSLGFEVTWETLSLDDEALADKTWRDVNGQYWKLPTYRIPICVYKNPL